jgi:hypothetical protein
MRLRVLSLLLLGALLLVPQTYAQPVRVVVQPPASYTPFKLVIQYSWTQDVLHNVTSVGQSDYVVRLTPTSLTFTTNETDRFTLEVFIHYRRPVNQTIVMGTFSGQSLGQSTYIPHFGDRLQLIIEVNTAPAPRFPTVEEITDSLMTRLMEHLSTTTYALYESIARMDRGERARWVIEGLTALTALTAVVALIVHVRRSRRWTAT